MGHCVSTNSASSKRAGGTPGSNKRTMDQHHQNTQTSNDNEHIREVLESNYIIAKEFLGGKQQKSFSRTSTAAFTVEVVTPNTHLKEPKPLVQQHKHHHHHHLHTTPQKMSSKRRHSSQRKEHPSVLDLSDIEVPAENRLQIHLGISPVKRRKQSGEQQCFHFETEPAKERSSSKRKSEYPQLRASIVIPPVVPFALLLKGTSDLEDEAELMAQAGLSLRVAPTSVQQQNRNGQQQYQSSEHNNADQIIKTEFIQESSGSSSESSVSLDRIQDNDEEDEEAGSFDSAGHRVLIRQPLLKPKTERQILRDNLLALFLDLIENRTQYPIELEMKKLSGCTVRRRAVDSGIDQFILERTDMGVLPWQFMSLLRRQEDFVKTNKRTKRFDMLELEQHDDMSEPVEIFSSILKSPTILISERTFIDAKYVWPEDNIAIMSSQGMDAFREIYQERFSQKDVTYGYDLMTAFKFEAVCDAGGVPQGTRVAFVSQSDFGGSVPKSLVQRVAPKEICGFLDEIVQAAKKVTSQ
ncbi:hypothetical protein FGO68_gene8835 [Halteria grandinella]|uniref:Uncharacterized protein n=1 Tax=Halteria grandinella TaxID=5974 RepID=A0A8J8NTU7_HALGN|nr:hypothetical protein FGO68_gene8835 [Halteria grandinella]